MPTSNPKKQKQTVAVTPTDSDEAMNGGEKEARNFLCYWCDFRGRWRSEIIQHMRCHHAREKPYRCSACMYASNWKWDVQKHTKKQHPNNVNAKIVEIPDQILFPDLKDFNFFENVKPNITPPILPSNSSHNTSATVANVSASPIIVNPAQMASPSSKKSSLSLTPPNSSSVSSSSSSSSINLSLNKQASSGIKNHKNLTNTNSSNQMSKQQPAVSNKPAMNSGNKASKHHSLCCQQCPYVACNLSDLRRHLIVHSNEQPYHCCACEFKSKWKSDVKKHQRNLNHIGPILVGKKAMQKVIENLGLDKTSMVTLYGPNIQVIDNKQCKSNEKLIDEDNIEFKNCDFNGLKNKSLQNNSNKSISLAKSNSIKRKRTDYDEDNQQIDGSADYLKNYSKNMNSEYEDEDYEQLNEEEEEEEEEADDEYEVLEYNDYDEHNAQANQYYNEEDENDHIDVDDYNDELNDEQLNGNNTSSNYINNNNNNYDNQETSSQFTDDEHQNEINNQNVNYDLNEIDNEEEIEEDLEDIDQED